MTKAKKKHKVAYYLVKTQGINYHQATMLIEYMTPDNFNHNLDKAQEWMKTTFTV